MSSVFRPMPLRSRKARRELIKIEIGCMRNYSASYQRHKGDTSAPGTTCIPPDVTGRP
jgi:hypothetical protein